MSKDKFNEEDKFDFLSEIMPDAEFNDENKSEKYKEVELESNLDAFTPTDEDLVMSSYLLVNTLLNILVQKGIIKMSEVKQLLQELHEQFMNDRRN